MLETAIEDNCQEKDENKRKGEEELKASKKASSNKLKKYRNSIKIKRTFIFLKGKRCVPASQLDKNDNNDGNTITTTQTVPVIEKYVLPVCKSQEEKKKQKAL